MKNNKYTKFIFILIAQSFHVCATPDILEVAHTQDEAGNHTITIKTPTAFLAANHEALSPENTTMHASINSIHDINLADSTTFTQEVSNFYNTKYHESLSFSELSLLKKAFDAAKNSNNYNFLNATLEDIAKSRGNLKVDQNSLDIIIKSAKDPKNKSSFNTLNVHIGHVVNWLTGTKVNNNHTGSAIPLTDRLTNERNKTALPVGQINRIIADKVNETLNINQSGDSNDILRAKLSKIAGLSHIEDVLKSYLLSESKGLDTFDNKEVFLPNSLKSTYKDIPQEIFKYLYYKESLFDSRYGDVILEPKISDDTTEIYNKIVDTEKKYPFLKKYTLSNTNPSYNDFGKACSTINRALFKKAFQHQDPTEEENKALEFYNKIKETKYTWSTLEKAKAANIHPYLSENINPYVAPKEGTKPSAGTQSAKAKPFFDQTIREESALHVLGLKPGATQGQIKTAFKQLALKYHPDKNSGNGEKMKEISAANDFLKELAERNA